MKYPEIEKLGLMTYKLENPFARQMYMRADVFVRADDLEKLLREATTVYLEELPTELEGYRGAPVKDATHTAKLMGITPIKREPMKVEFDTYLSGGDYIAIPPKYKFSGAKKIKVIIEEMGE